ncbi:MAG: class I SAM-dependent methyltransferase [Flavobacteriales bacterium]|nr:class I SAM-dependent methyltransferase [Flavobacteriales bacterium]
MVDKPPYHLDPSVIAILRCPISGSPLKPANAEDIDMINRAVENGSAKWYSGKVLTGPVQNLLVDEQQLYFYEIRDGIMVLIRSLAIPHPDKNIEVAAPEEGDEVTAGAMKFYDEFGWTIGDQAHVDAEKWEDLRPLTAKYRARCHMKIHQFLQKQGEFLLDVASGPLQYDEYLTYSGNYRKRICVDVSVNALMQAQKRLGENGVYILGDITNLPFETATIDTALSLHTIYHVDKSKQLKAIEELCRVAKPGPNTIIVYTWAGHARIRKFMGWYEAVSIKLASIGIKAFAPLKIEQKSSNDLPHDMLYFHAYSYEWFRKNVTAPFTVYSWRITSVPFMQRFVKEGWVGKILLGTFNILESLFPKFMGRFGQYPIIVINTKKKA